MWPTCVILDWFWDFDLSFAHIKVHKTRVEASIFLGEVTNTQTTHSVVTVTYLLCTHASVTSFPRANSLAFVTCALQCFHVFLRLVAQTWRYNLNRSFLVQFFKLGWKKGLLLTCNAHYVTRVGPEMVAKNTVVPSSCLARRRTFHLPNSILMS